MKPFDPNCLKKWSGYEIFAKSRNGYFPSDIQIIAHAYGLSIEKLARILGISKSTLYKNKKDSSLPIYVVEHLMMLENVAYEGYALFTDKRYCDGTFLEWVEQNKNYLISRSGLSIMRNKLLQISISREVEV